MTMSHKPYCRNRRRDRISIAEILQYCCTYLYSFFSFCSMWNPGLFRPLLSELYFNRVRGSGRSRWGSHLGFSRKIKLSGLIGTVQALTSTCNFNNYVTAPSVTPPWSHNLVPRLHEESHMS